jgi:hypothetical protein
MLSSLLTYTKQYQERRAYAATSLTVLYGVQSNHNAGGVYKTELTTVPRLGFAALQRIRGRHTCPHFASSYGSKCLVPNCNSHTTRVLVTLNKQKCFRQGSEARNSVHYPASFQLYIMCAHIFILSTLRFAVFWYSRSLPHIRIQ